MRYVKMLQERIDTVKRVCPNIRLEFLQSTDFNQMLVNSTFVHLLALTILLFLPSPKYQELIVIPTFKLDIIALEPGKKTASPSAVGQKERSPKPIAKKVVAKRLPPSKPVAKKTETIRKQLSDLELMLGNAGTAMRPLTAALTLGQGRYVLDGVPRMRERPIVDLVEGLQQLGAKVRLLNGPPGPPVEILAQGLPGGTARIKGSVSSQFLSAILMAAPGAQKDVMLEIDDTLVSVPYVEMTLALMERFGVHVENRDFQEFHIPGKQTYHSPGDFFVEGDASSASYFLAGAAITGGTVTVHGCGTESLQGDSKFAEVLEQMGAEPQWQPHSVTVRGNTLKGVDLDMNRMPDAAMTLAVAALFAEGTTKIRNVYNWRLKETERMKAVTTELRKLGAEVEEGDDYLIIDPPDQIQSTEIETYDDHRMAMAFSLAACGAESVTILDPGCVSKTFPDYFEVLKSVSE